VRENAARMLDRVLPAIPDRALAEGETLSIGRFRLQVIWTPGHSHDHICLYDPQEGILFSGDHLLPDIVPHIGLEVEAPQDPLGEYLASLEKLAPLEVRLVLPGHGEPFPRHRRRVGELLSYHRRNLDRLARLLGPEPRTPYELAAAMDWEEEFDWGTGPPLLHAGLVTKTLAYLRHLGCLGEAEATMDGVVRRFVRKGF